MTLSTIAGRKSMRNAIAGFALFAALTVPGIALAATSSADVANYCVKSAQGCESSASAIGSGAGAFGAIGRDNNLSIPRYPGDAKGADGTQTGINNSSLAGNRAYAQGTTSTPQETPRTDPSP